METRYVHETNSGWRLLASPVRTPTTPQAKAALQEIFSYRTQPQNTDQPKTLSESNVINISIQNGGTSEYIPTFMNHLPSHAQLNIMKMCVQNSQEKLDGILHPVQITDPALLQEVVTILSSHFKTNVQIKSVIQLSESERRNMILRIKLKNKSEEIPESLILKQSLLGKSSNDDKAFARFARDWAGLAFLNNLTAEEQLTPRFYGGSTKYRFLLLEDLGEKHISLVNSLTSVDANAAKEALKRFMSRLGQLHAVSYGNTSDYLKILQTLNPHAAPWQDDVTFDDIVLKLEPLLKRIDISDSSSIRSEINTVILELLEPGPFTTLIHGDICPDNVFDDAKKDELRFIDFEWAFVKNALLDGTYLRMSMPTCWCANTIPHDVIESLEAAYRSELIKKIPAAQDDKAYYDAYTNACAFWMLKAVLLIDMLEKEGIDPSFGSISEKFLLKPGINRILSRVLSRLQSFIDVSKRYERLPNLRAMAEQTMYYLNVKFPDAKPMAMYSAFIPKQFE